MADEKGPGLLESALIGAPIVAGVAAAARQAGTTAVEDQSGSLLGALRTASAARGDASIADALSYMKSKEGLFLQKEGSRIAQIAWEQAMAAADPISKERFYSFAQGLAGRDPADIFSAISRDISSNQSNLMQRIFSRFRENVDVLEWHHRKIGGFPNLTSLGGLRVDPGPLPFNKIPAGVQGYFSKISEALGPGLSQRIAREGLPGEAFRFHWRTPAGLEVGFSLPVTHEGIALMGESLQTRYISPDIILADLQKGEFTRMSRQEFFLREFETSILPAIQSGGLRSQAEINLAIKKMETSIFRELETLPNVPEGLEPEWLRRYREFRGQQVDIRVIGTPAEHFGPFDWAPSTRVPTTAEYMQIMERNNLFGGVGAMGVSRGRAQSYNLADLFPTPRRTAMGRMPQQAIRPWGYTDEAIKLSGAMSDLHLFDTSARQLYAPAPYLTTAYVDPEKYHSQLSRAGLNEGEALMSSRIKAMMQQEYMTSTHLTAVDQDVMEMIYRGEKIVPGTVIGRDVKTGALVRAPAEAEGWIFGAERFKSVNRGDFATLWQINKRHLQQQEKWFGDLKVLARFVENKVLQSTLGSGTIGSANLVDVLATMDDLKKDPAKLNKQILTGLYQTMLQKDLDPWAERFMRKPLSFARTWDRTQKSQRAFVERAMQFAVKHGNLTDAEFGRVFGAVPTVFGPRAAYEMAQSAGLASTQGFREMFRRIAIGGAQLTWGGPLEGVGGMGSIEPRIFDILSGAPYRDTPFAGELSDDLARRVALTSPERVHAFEAITKSLRSMQGLEAMPEGTTPWYAAPAGEIPARPYERRAFQEFIEAGGGWMKMGKGMSDIFVPGIEVQAMQPHATPTGKIAGYLPDVYHRIAERASALASGEISLATMQDYMKKAQAELAKQAAPAGKGIGGFLRGKVAGSRYLTAVSQIGEYSPPDINTIGVSRTHIEDMFDEMRRLGLWGTELEEMRSRFRQEGKVRGMVARHPFIGAFSMQPVTFEAVETLADTVAVAERSARMNIGGELVTMNLSPMLGMAADKDADALSLFLVSPKTERHLAQYMEKAGNEYQVAYAQHQMRLQLVKAKKAAGAMTLAQIEKNIYGDISKLGIIQREVPFLSTELTTARRAALRYMEGSRLADAQFLLEWLEQTPISGKHIKGSETLSFEAQMKAIRSAFVKRDPSRLLGEIQEIVKEGVGARLLSQDLAIKESRDAEQILGFSLGNKLRGIDVESTSKELMGALQRFDREGHLEKSRMISGMGRRLFETPEVKQFLQTVSSSGGHAMGEAVSARQTVSNLLGKVGRSITRHHKPIGLGLAGAIAVSLVLSSPKETVGSGRGMMARARMSRGRAADQVRPEDMQAGAPMGSPTAPGMMHQNATYMAGPPRSRTYVRARSNFMVTPSHLASAMSRMTGGGSSVNLSVRDSRSGINPYTLADKILG